ncbi:pentatricopeptide repeat-containing protein At2g36240 isoform X2 [Abrus precatorius]|nr:pentatricopeptide repeat-containing protein At2g36240 isoform X2 [Abrus precatorius]
MSVLNSSSGFQYAFNQGDRISSDGKHYLIPKSLPSEPPLSPIPNPPLPSPPPDPPVSTLHYNRFLHFLKTHLSPPLTSDTLLHFLKSKLHRHPSFSHFDFHLFNWASSIDSFRHTHSTFHWMAHTLTTTHRLPQLRSLLRFIASNPCPCSNGIFSCPQTEPIFCIAIHAFSKASKLDDAVFAFHTMRRLIDGKPGITVCNILIHGFVKCGQHDRALQFYHEMMVRDRVKPDVFTFNILISSYCRHSQFGLALDMFNKMREMGCYPNVVTFNTLIKGMFRDGKIEEGIGMAHEMVELGCQFSCVTCEILVQGLCEGGRFLQACELLVEFSKRMILPKGYDYFELVEVLCGKGNAVRALQLIYELWDRGSAPSLIACAVMIDGLRRLRKMEEAWRLVERMLQECMVLDVVTFNCVLQDICNLQRTEEANKLRLLASSKGLKPDGMTFKILVMGYMGEGNREEGESVVNEMLDRGFISDLASYNKLMDGLLLRQRSICHQVNKFDR